MIYTYDEIQGKERELESKINAEYKHIQISTLGGKERASILISISLDKKEDWKYSIFQNSRYYQFHISNDGKVENFSKNHTLKRIRKKTIKSLDEAIQYINDKIKVQ